MLRLGANIFSGTASALSVLFYSAHSNVGWAYLGGTAGCDNDLPPGNYSGSTKFFLVLGSQNLSYSAIITSEHIVANFIRTEVHNGAQR